MKSRLFALAVISLALTAAAKRPVDLSWPAWRGPHDNGSAELQSYPADWSQGDRILWKADLPGKGCSTPAVFGDRIFVTCPVEANNGVLAFDWTGKQLWSAQLGPEQGGKHRNGSGSNPSPVTDGKRVFAYFKSGDLAGLDFDGQMIWKTNLQQRFAKDTLWWDVGTSPVLTDNSVVVAVMHTGESYLAAFDKQTGDLQWKVARNYQTPVEGDQSYTTPNVVERDGRQVVVVWGAEHLTGHAADDGHVLWHCDGFNPKQQPNWIAVASSVVVDNLVIVPWGRGEFVTAVRLGGSGDVTESHRVWTRTGTGSFVPTPAVFDGKLYIVRDAGEVECLDAKTGQTVWQDRFPKHRLKYYASPLVADGKLYAAREDGVVFVATIDGTFKIVSENNMGEPVIASPAAVDGRLLIRGEEHLFCIGQNGK